MWGRARCQEWQQCAAGAVGCAGLPGRGSSAQQEQWNAQGCQGVAAVRSRSSGVRRVAGQPNPEGPAAAAQAGKRAGVQAQPECDISGL